MRRGEGTERDTQRNEASKVVICGGDGGAVEIIACDEEKCEWSCDDVMLWL